MYSRSFAFFALITLLSSCSKTDGDINNKTECDNTRYEVFEQRIRTSDGQGHGPDIGSEEWKSVIEFKLGIQESSEVPDADSSAWCTYIEELIEKSSS